MMPKPSQYLLDNVPSVLEAKLTAIRTAASILTAVHKALSAHGATKVTVVGHSLGKFIV